ncbi:helix-turn-helix domain-containing protein [Nocardia heshunensis]
MTFDRRAELGEFLRSRRARLRPEEFGLISHGRQRRVLGLRREELAQLAGVSVDHYVRLEQGRTLQFSDEILGSVAEVLRLDPTERGHFYRLARPAAVATVAPADSAHVSSCVASLLAVITGAPAYVIDRRTDVVAWNRLAAAFIVDFGALSPVERNMSRLVFLDEGVRALYVDWWARAREVAAFLRQDLARPPVLPAIQALIAELLGASAEFRQVWAEHGVRESRHGSHLYRHPKVGEVELTYETLRLPAHPDLALVVHTAADGSPAQDALRLLA